MNKIIGVLFDELAAMEYKDAVEYYNLQISGLGDRLKNEVKTGIRRILANPYLWSTEKGDVRKYLLHRFPYKILFSIEHDYIYIIAIAHSHRKPDYWVDRLLSNE